MTTSMTARTRRDRGGSTDGAYTRVPRWTRVPVPGTAEHLTALPEHLPAALRRVADRLRMPLSSVLLAAHAKVLAVLSGDHEVTTGYLAERSGTPLPCRLTTAAGSWRTLLLDTHRAEVELLRRRGFPAAGSGPEPAPAEESPETVFDLPGADGGPVGDTVLWVALVRHDGREVLRLRYRTEVLDADCAARIGGYYRTALTLLAADPDAEHRRQSLLSAEELRCQLEGLAGPSRSLPDRRFHEVFQQRVRSTRTPSPPYTGAGGGRTANSTSAPTGWRTPCWPAGWAGKRSSRWSPNATWSGWPRSSRSSRPAGCTCRWSRTFRPAGSR